MLSDACFEFARAVTEQGEDSNDVERLRHHVHYYSSPPYDYDPRLIQMLHHYIDAVMAQQVPLDKLVEVADNVVQYLDDPACPSLEGLLQKCGYAPA